MNEMEYTAQVLFRVCLLRHRCSASRRQPHARGSAQCTAATKWSLLLYTLRTVEEKTKNDYSWYPVSNPRVNDAVSTSGVTERLKYEEFALRTATNHVFWNNQGLGRYSNKFVSSDRLGWVGLGWVRLGIPLIVTFPRANNENAVAIYLIKFELPCGKWSLSDNNRWR